MVPGGGGGIGKDTETIVIFIGRPRNVFRVRLSIEKVDQDFGPRYVPSPFPEKPWDGSR